MQTVTNIPIEIIEVGKRFREDLGDINNLVESVKDKGILQPITVVETDHGYTLVAGGRRIEAAKRAGLYAIPALVRDQTGIVDCEVDLREIELIENTCRKDFTWLEQANLVAELDKLCKEKNVDWSARKTAKLLGDSHPMNVSRSLKIIDALPVLPELAECKTQDEALKKIQKMEEILITNELRKRQDTIRNGGLRDTLKLAEGHYRIGDAFDGMAALSDNSRIDLIEVDPPYGIDLPETKRGTAADNYKEVALKEYPAFVHKLAEETFRIADRNSWMIFWFGPTHFTLVKTALKTAGWEVDDIPGIWSKGNGQTMQPATYLARCYEPFFICRKGKPAIVKQGRSNVFDFSPVAGTKKYHPTERPVALIEEIINTFILPNSCIFVPFLGSGATIRAAYNTGSIAYGYDLDPAYKDKFMLAIEADTKAIDSNDAE